MRSEFRVLLAFWALVSPLVGHAAGLTTQGTGDHLAQVREVLKQAHRTARQIARDKYGKHDVLKDIAKLQIKAGDVQGARKTATDIEDGFIRKQVLALIQRPSERPDDAPEKLVPDVQQQGGGPRDVWALRDAVVARVRAGDLPGALKIITDPAFDSGWKGCGLMHIAGAQAGVGDVDGALRTVNSIRGGMPGPFAQAFEQGMTNGAWLRIALGQAKAGDLSGALKRAQTLSGEDLIAHAFQGIAVARGNTPDAKNVIHSVAKRRSLLVRARSLLGIAEGLMGLEEPSYLAAEPCWPAIFSDEYR